MKHVRSVVLATLATFAMMACENSNLTSVVDPSGGLEQAAKPDCNADPSHPSCKDDGGDDGGDPQALFDVTITGDVSGGPTEGHEGVVERQIVVDLFTLDIGSIAAALVDGATCFPTGQATSVLALTQSSEDANVVEVSIFFKAQGNDGTDVKYGLKMSGALGGDPWLPTATSTIDLTTWEIGHDTGKGKKVACSGSGAFQNVTTATVTAK